jgi:hypothetical protein
MTEPEPTRNERWRVFRALRSDLVDPTIALHAGDVVEESDGDLMADRVRVDENLRTDGL